MVCTSVVSRVMREAVLNLSTLAKEKDCTFSNSPRRSSLPKPIPAMEAKRELVAPKQSPRIAISTIIPPVRST